MSRFAVIDFETTGLSPESGDRAIEIGVVIIENERLGRTFESLINPGVSIPAFITSLTGIDGRMVESAPAPEHVFPEVARFVGDATLVAHNASFDRRFWSHELGRVGLDKNFDFVCTMLLSRRLYPWSLNHQLGTLVDLHGIDVEGDDHRALADAQKAATLLLQVMSDLERLYGSEDLSPEFLRRYQRTPIAKVRSAPG